jgi:2-polyprenyl-6-methoxyphenol hydroxylase-like FAD-dependent oxidoreductase
VADNDRVVVVGAGISGLCVALALELAGIPVTVLERAPELQAIGGAITIWFNGVAGLDRLGLADEIDAVGSRLENQEMLDRRGRLLFEIAVGELTTANGLRPPIVVRRSDLLQTLSQSLRDGTVQAGVAYEGHDEQADGLAVRLSTGESVYASVLVAADGIDSGIRRSLFPQAEPRYAGYQYLRAIPEFEDARVPPGRFTFTFGPGDRFGINGANGWTYWFAVIVAAPGTGDSEAGRKADLLERFRDFPPPVCDFIEATETAIGRVDIRDLDPLESWRSGRLTLLGDAAHATTPNLARGAGEAIEDAVALADELAKLTSLRDGTQVEAALRTFEERRRPASASVQTKARRIGKIASWRNPIACTAREQLLRRVMGKAIVKEMAAEAEALGRARSTA